MAPDLESVVDATSADAAPVGVLLRQEVGLAVARAAAVWRECGLQPGEAVAVRLDHSTDVIVACLGAASAGGRPVVVDPRLPAGDLERLHRAGGWRFILAESRPELPAALRDFVLTRAEWRQALQAAGTQQSATMQGS